MKVLIVGRGKLARSLLDGLECAPFGKEVTGPAIVIHAGSGRELASAIAFCEKHHSPLIQAATGLQHPENPPFPYIIAPNLALPMCRLIAALDSFAPHFKLAKIELKESHQSTKKTLAGTAAVIGAKFGIEEEAIISQRDRAQQERELAVAEEYLDHHAVHQVCIEEDGVVIKLEARVMGSKSYVEGAKQIAAYVEKLPAGIHFLEKLVIDQLL